MLCQVLGEIKGHCVDWYCLLGSSIATILSKFPNFKAVFFCVCWCQCPRFTALPMAYRHEPEVTAWGRSVAGRGGGVIHRGAWKYCHRGVEHQLQMAGGNATRCHCCHRGRWARGVRQRRAGSRAASAEIIFMGRDERHLNNRRDSGTRRRHRGSRKIIDAIRSPLKARGASPGVVPSRVLWLALLLFFSAEVGTIVRRLV